MKAHLHRILSGVPPVLGFLGPGLIITVIALILLNLWLYGLFDDLPTVRMEDLLYLASIILFLLILTSPWLLGVSLISVLVLYCRPIPTPITTKARLRHFLHVAVRVLGLLFIISPIAFPLLRVWHTLTFPPESILEYVEEWGGLPYPHWGASYLLTQYLGDLIMTLPSLAAFGAGLWLIFTVPSWKKAIGALLTSYPWLFILSFECLQILADIRTFI